MSDVVVLGDDVHIRGFALSGAEVAPADSVEDAVNVWEGLPEETKLVIMTQAVADRLGESALAKSRSLVAVIPE